SSTILQAARVDGRRYTLFQRSRMMMCRAVASMLAIAMFVVAIPTRAGDKTAPSNAQRFETLKKLAGAWVEVGQDGKATDKVVSSIRVTAAGSAIEERLFPGSDHEMVTLYHLDGDDLVLTHYCSLGNQPRLRAEPGKDVNTIVFTFVSATNLKSKD